MFSDKGIFNRAESAGAKYNEAKAREVLETVLLADGQYEKNINPEYNQDEFLDELIKSEIPGSDVKGDVAIIGEYAYELDRSVPKIGRYLGRVDDLVFPTVTATEPVLAPDYRTASFTVTALEDKNGINKIEIWFAGEKIETLTKIYGNVKTEITESFTVNRNGKYTIKAYGDLMASVAVEVTGIVPAVEFSPNGSTEWKKGHTTKIIVKETGERVTSLKYKWTTSGANEPSESEFTETCPTDNVITGKDFTGTYYLWVLLTTETGKTNICGSEGFNFDNEGPIVELTSTPTTDTSFTLTATANDDNKSGIAKYEFYVDGEKVDTQNINEGVATYIWNENGMTKDKECYVIVTDKTGNLSNATVISRTKLYAWEKWSNKIESVFSLGTPTRKTKTVYVEEGDYVSAYSNIGVTQVPKDKLYIYGSGRIVNIYHSPSKGVGMYYQGEYPLFYTPSDASISNLTVASRLVDYEILETYASTGRKRIKWTCDVYTGAYKNEDRMNKFLDEIVYSENPNAYKEGSKNSDGFWYKKLENQ